MRVKTEERRQAIVETAKEAFKEQGFEHTSMSYIAKKVGGSKATLYNYFSSKEDIFAAVMESSATQDVTLAFQNLSKDIEPEKALFDFGINYLQSVLSPELCAIHKMALSEAGHSDISRYFYLNGPGKGRQDTAKYIEYQMEKGLLKQADPNVAAAQLIALLNAELVDPYEMHVIEKPSDTELRRVADTAIRSFLCIYDPTKASD